MEDGFLSRYETSKGKYVIDGERSTLCVVVGGIAGFLSILHAVLCRLPLAFFVGFALFGSSAGVSTLAL